MTLTGAFLCHKKQMKNQHYSATIEVASSPGDVFACINDVPKWWATPAFNGTFEGKSKNHNDEFVVRFGDAHYSKQRLVEFIQDEKIVWLVTDSRLQWIKNNKTEWTGSKMIFELVASSDHTVLKFTHEGLLPHQECYRNCAKGWDMLIKENLFNVLKGVSKNN